MYALCQNSQQDTQVLIFEVKKRPFEAARPRYFFLHFSDYNYTGVYKKNYSPYLVWGKKIRIFEKREESSGLNPEKR